MHQHGDSRALSADAEGSRAWNGERKEVWGGLGGTPERAAERQEEVPVRERSSEASKGYICLVDT